MVICNFARNFDINMKKLFISLVFSMLALMVSAAPISKQQAKEKAKLFLSSRGRQVVSEPRRAPGTTNTECDQPLYVFNAANNKGFVIIAGDDRVESVLGYAEAGNFDENDLPVNVRSWLLMTAEEIKALPSSPKTEAHSPRLVAAHSAIKPLIKTQWNQGSATNTGDIYNTLTPTINAKHCVTGCVATAGAQLMFYYQYPQQETQPVPGYRPNDTIGDLDGLPSIQFNWSEMKESYSYSDEGTDSEQAVSELMLYCGYAATMDYGLNGSSASHFDLAEGLVNYFDYDPHTWEYVLRSSYTVSDWDALIYNELKDGRPVIFSGRNNHGGHAFLCDGYDGAGLYHFNWGWGGAYDGYFKLNATNPYDGEEIVDGLVDIGYVLSVSAIIGLQPNTGQSSPVTVDDNDTWEEPQTEGIVANARNPHLEGSVISAYLQNPNSETANLALGIGELQADGTVTPIDTQYKYYWYTDLPAGYKFSDVLSFDVSTYDLSDGTHQLVFISIANNDTEWVRCQPVNIYYEVTVEGGEIVSIIEHPVVNLQATDFTCTGTLQPKFTQKLSFKVTNIGDNYRGSIYLFASTTEDKGYPKSSIDIAIKNGNTKERTMSLWTGTAGTYHVWLCTDYDGTNVIGQTTVKIAQELEVTKFDIQGNNYVTVLQPIVASVSNKYGEFNGQLYFFASTSANDKGSCLYTAVGAIGEGQTEDIKFYYIPTETGTYTIWVCTDDEGTNVIGTTQVTISSKPDYEVRLTQVSLEVESQPICAAKVCVKNETEHDYNELFLARLYILRNRYEWMWDIKTPCQLIKAGETATVTIPLTGLEAGNKYYVEIYYKPKVGGNYADLGDTDFTFVEPKYEMGDVNHDGRVDVADMIMVINHILNIRLPNFYEAQADINGDDIITVTDVMMIVKAIF